MNQWFAFSLVRQWEQYFSLLNQSIFIDWISEKYFLLLNQLIFTEVISQIWLIHSNLFLAIWIGQISLIISRFLMIQIKKVRVLFTFSSWMRRYCFYVKNDFRNFHQIFTFWDPLSQKKRVLRKCLSVCSRSCAA